MGAGKYPIGKRILNIVKEIGIYLVNKIKIIFKIYQIGKLSCKKKVTSFE